MTSGDEELDLAPAEAAALVRAQYGVEPLAVRKLESELSTVVRIDLATGAVVAKLHRYSPEALDATRWRVAAMQHLDRAGIPAGRPLADRSGDLVARVDASQGAVVVQVSEWLPGVPLEATPATPEVLRGVGRTAARVAGGLAGWPAPPVRVAHPWELVRTLATIEGVIERVGEGATRAVVEQAADRFRQVVAPGLGDLPRAVVHHDLHDSNLLIDQASGRVSGVLDFGDMVVGPRMAELAVAAAYASRNAPDPVAALLLVAEGWGRSVPLTDAEIVALPAAAIGRLAVNAAVWASREDTARGSYARSRSGRSGSALRALLDADQAVVESELRRRLA